MANNKQPPETIVQAMGALAALKETHDDKMQQLVLVFRDAETGKVMVGTHRGESEQLRVPPYSVSEKLAEALVAAAANFGERGGWGAVFRLYGGCAGYTGGGLWEWFVGRRGARAD